MERVKVESDGACDFCGRQEPTRTYDAGQEVPLAAFMESGPKLGPTMCYSRTWLSCEKCGELIDGGDWSGLLAMVLEMPWLEGAKPPRNEEERELMRRALGAVYGKLEQLGLKRVQ